MKSMTRVTLLLVLCAGVIYLAGCGGGGGTAQPEDIATGAINAIKGENFTALYNYGPQWARDAQPKETEVRKWRAKEKWDLWKDFKKRFDGDGNLDPKNKSGITESEEKWMGASDAQRTAVLMGLYRIYNNEEWEKRLKEGDWYLDGRDVKLDIEGQGRATFTYRNRYNDTITVVCTRENALWSLGNVTVEMPKDMPKKPKDE
ncbi:MAG: hypothetical protein IT462_04075 [Planctomycetes bacterium]|nr:hypothetical protein [Planctomycetota bacterium]